MEIWQERNNSSAFCRSVVQNNRAGFCNTSRCCRDDSAALLDLLVAQIPIDQPGNAVAHPFFWQSGRGYEVMPPALLKLSHDNMRQINLRTFYNYRSIFTQPLGHEMNATLRIERSGTDIGARHILVPICIGSCGGAYAIKDCLA